jgi:hypothetical protein
MLLTAQEIGANERGFGSASPQAAIQQNLIAEASRKKIPYCAPF